MQKLEYRDGLLYTSVELSHEGKSIVIENVIVDTGAFHTIIAPQFLEDLDVGFSEDDELVKAFGYGGTVSYSVRKKIDTTKCGDIGLENIKLDFGEIDPNEIVNGLLGLDFLKGSGIIIDLVELSFYKKQ